MTKASGLRIVAWGGVSREITHAVSLVGAEPLHALLVHPLGADWPGVHVAVRPWMLYLALSYELNVN